jgi:hypothetical protein
MPWGPRVAGLQGEGNLIVRHAKDVHLGLDQGIEAQQAEEEGGFAGYVEGVGVGGGGLLGPKRVSQTRSREKPTRKKRMPLLTLGAIMNSRALMRSAFLDPRMCHMTAQRVIEVRTRLMLVICNRRNRVVSKRGRCSTFAL